MACNLAWLQQGSSDFLNRGTSLSNSMLLYSLIVNYFCNANNAQLRTAQRWGLPLAHLYRVLSAGNDVQVGEFTAEVRFHEH
jgi:hypothetical protein